MCCPEGPSLHIALHVIVYHCPEGPSLHIAWPSYSVPVGMWPTCLAFPSYAVPGWHVATCPQRRFHGPICMLKKRAVLHRLNCFRQSHMLRSKDMHLECPAPKHKGSDSSWATTAPPDLPSQQSIHRCVALKGPLCTLHCHVIVYHCPEGPSLHIAWPSYSVPVGMWPTCLAFPSYAVPGWHVATCPQRRFHGPICMLKKRAVLRRLNCLRQSHMLRSKDIHVNFEKSPEICSADLCRHWNNL